MNIGQAGPSSRELSRRAFTATEVLVAISCVALLVTLTVPAVLRARETSRLTDCRNRLRQIGHGSLNYYSAHSATPEGNKHHFQLLPYLGFGPLYERLAALPPGELQNVTRNGTELGSLSAFVCPSDSAANPEDHSVNYRLNLGTSWDLEPGNGMVTGWRGTGVLRMQDVRDGASNTSWFSERLMTWDRRKLIGEIHRGSRASTEIEVLAAQNPKRYWWHMNRRYYLGEEKQLVSDCRKPEFRSTVWPLNPRRLRVLLFSNSSSYYHLGTPNEVACNYGTSQRVGGRGTTPPSSEHSGGVSVLLVDGSVTFVGETIDEAVWEAIGTRTGRELAANWPVNSKPMANRSVPRI